MIKHTHRMIAKQVKKTVRTFEKLCKNQTASSPSKKVTKKQPVQNGISAISIEEQVNQIMALPEPEESGTPAKPKKSKVGLSKNKSLSRILQYVLHEAVLDIKFLCYLIAYYSRSVFQKTLGRLQHAIAKTKKAKKTRSGALSEASKPYVTFGKDKVYESLMMNNSEIVEDINEYKQKYNERSKSKLSKH